MAEDFRDRKRHYELIYVLSPAINDAAVKVIVENNSKLVKDLGGSLLRQDDWGKKRLAYPMEKHQMGQYFYLRFIGNSALVKALERNLKLDASVLRYMTIQLSEPLPQSEIEKFIERAPKEASQAPTLRDEDEHYLDAAYS